MEGSAPSSCAGYPALIVDIPWSRSQPSSAMDFPAVKLKRSWQTSTPLPGSASHCGRGLISSQSLSALGRDRACIVTLHDGTTGRNPTLRAISGPPSLLEACLTRSIGAFGHSGRSIREAFKIAPRRAGNPTHSRPSFRFPVRAVWSAPHAQHRPVLPPQRRRRQG